MAARPLSCESCGRHALPEVSDVPPSPMLRDQLTELLRFAREFDELDPGHYTAVDFVDWMALNVGSPIRNEPAGRPGRGRDARRNTQLSLALAG